MTDQTFRSIDFAAAHQKPAAELFENRRIGRRVRLVAFI
jgi:hypothetical protein